MNEVHRVPRLVTKHRRRDLGREVQPSRQHSRRHQHSRHRFRSHELDGRGRWGRSEFLLEVGGGGDEEIRDVFVGSSTSKLAVSGHGDVGDSVLLEVLAHELGFRVLVDEDDDLRVELSVSSVVDEGASQFEENVGFPVSSGPGDFGDGEVVRESMEVGSDETSRFWVALLDVVGEGFRNRSGGEDEVRGFDALEEGIEDGFGVIDEVGV